jgi:hypothetical protein
MTLMPEQMRPKMVCLPSKKGAGARVIKNCSMKEKIGDHDQHVMQEAPHAAAAAAYIHLLLL